MKRPELLIPAGNLEKLRTAILYGADAVYVGVEGLSLRAKRAEFNMDDLALGINEAHEKGVKVYAAMNVFARQDELELAADLVHRLTEMAVDGVIVSDPGMLQMIRKNSPTLPIHLSTQANTTNAEAVRFWRAQGVRRIVLARELNLAEVGQIANELPEVELELFIHGAMCLAYSGRCFLSAYWNGRSSNRGDCTQPCRWDYLMMESSRPNQLLTVEEDERYSYILSSKDLCMINYIPQLLESGVSSLKIEGRMKSVYYVAAVTRIYRWAIDAYLLDPGHYHDRPEWLEELRKVSYRDYTTGFYFANEKINEINSEVNYVQTHDLVGTVLSYSPSEGRILVGVRNRLTAMDEVELLLPTHTVRLDLSKLSNDLGIPIKEAHNGYRVYLPVSCEVPQRAVLRRRIQG